MHQNTFSDVPINYTFDIELDRACSSSELSDYLRVYDSTRYEYSLKFDDIGSSKYRVSSNKHYQVGDRAFGNLASISSLAIKKADIIYGKAIFANDTFELDLYNSISLTENTLIDYQGFIVNM